jgi:hypothetical protein
MRRKLWALGGALLLLVAGCGGKGQAGAGASPSTTGRPVDPVPPVITVGYVNQVLARLNVVYSDALRISLTTKQITPQVKTDLRAIYADPLYQQEISGFRLQLQHIPTDLRSHLGDRVITVARLISAGPHCIFIATRTSFSELVVDPPRPVASEYYSLVTKAPNADTQRLNPTPWMFGFNLASLVPKSVADPCNH